MRYDELGRLAQVLAPVAIDNDGTVQPREDTLTTGYGYDELGHKVWQQDAKGRITRFSYDKRGRMVSRTLPPVSGEPNRSEYMAYNALGQMTAKTDFRGYTTSFAYDLRGRMTAKVPDSRLGEASVLMSYPDEFTKRAQRGSFETVYKYDESRGFLSEVQAPNGTLRYGYDSAGNKTSMATLQGQNTVSTTLYSYDDLSRLENVTLPSNQVVHYDYDEVGNKKQVTRPNGTQTRYAYDDLNRLTDMVSERGATELSRFHYTLRADGKRIGVQESIAHAAAANRAATYREVAYSYDDHGWLTGESGQDGEGTPYSKTYTHDEVGNRVGLSVTKNGQLDSETTHTYNARDEIAQLTTVDTTGAHVVSYGYDLNGSQTSATGAPGTAQAYTTAYQYDFEGHLVTTGQQGVATGYTSYRYDANGQRLSTTTKVGVAEQQKTTTYLVDETQPFAQVVEERDGDGVLQHRYFHGLEMGPLRQDSKSENGVGGYLTSFALPDGLDSTRQLTGADGVVTDSYFYDAFGNSLSGNSGNTPNQYRFNGQQLDSASGLYYLRARYYNQGLGRFLSHDPLLGSSDDPISLHRYLYAGADAVNAVDPSGAETLFGVQMSLSMQLAISSGVTSAAIAGWDTALSGGSVGDVVKSESIGFIMGAAFGAAGSVNVLRFPLGCVGVYFSLRGLQGSYQAYQQGNSVLAFYRGTVSIAGLLGSAFLIRQGLQDLNTVTWPRNPADVALQTNSPTPPSANNGTGYIGSNATQIAELNSDVANAIAQGATDIRVNQHQVDVNGIRVGRNRPDLQYTLNNRRVYIEYDTHPAPRSQPHGQRIRSNDTNGLIILKVWDALGSLTSSNF